MKSFLSTILAILIGSFTALAQGTPTLVQGNQVKTEDELVSGKPYLLYYVSNSKGCYVKANSSWNYFQVSDNDKTITDEAIFILTQEGNTWKIQSQKTSKYFPVPTKNESHEFIPVEESSAGLWTLNFFSDGVSKGNIAPSCNGLSLNRWEIRLHGWDLGTDNVNQFKIYELAFTATASEVYTIKNSNGDDVISSPNDHWVFVPTGYGNYYYMYNINAQQFVSDTNFTLGDVAVPVSVNYKSITTQDGKTLFGIGNDTNLKVEKLSLDPFNPENDDDFIAAKNKLLGYNNKVTKLTNVSEIGEIDFTTTVDGIERVNNPNDGWYALRIHSDSDNPVYGGNFLYTLASEFEDIKGWKYPLSHGGSDYPKHPTANDAYYYVRLWPISRTVDGVTKTYYHWQVPTGKYVVNYLNNYPIIFNRPASDFIIEEYDDEPDGTFYFQSSDFRAKAWEDHIDKTARKHMDSSTRYEIYKVNPSELGLTAWQVIFNEGVNDVKLECTRQDVKGPNAVYNRGYFFLPTGQTPNSATEFKINGTTVTATVNVAATATAPANSIEVIYAPDVCFTADNVTVVQGARTTGLGNTKQALLRVEVKPLAPCHLKSFTLNLAGATNLTKVEAYLSSADQLNAEGETKFIRLGSTTIRSGESDDPDGEYIINVDEDDIHDILNDNATIANPLLTSGESNYIWITADIISADAAESEIVDAAITSISYQNTATEPVSNSCDISAKGDPEGYMRIFKKQSYVWVSTENNPTGSRYYRTPALLSLGDGTLLAFGEYRHDNINGLGKDYDGSDNGHCIDVVMRKSTDNGATWETPVVIAEGTEATGIGYGNPAVVKTGSTIICLMSKGEHAYDSSTGLTQIFKRTSTNSGSTWTAPEEITINWNGVAHHSAYVTSGKGLVYRTNSPHPNRIAFVVNVKASASGSTKEYLLYSDDNGTSWAVDPTPLSGKGKESKLEEKNDGSLYVTGKVPASKDCNNDVLYFIRGEGENPDAILQTVIWKYDGDPVRLRDLRLYASFDFSTKASWQLLFTVTEANAAASSMQELSDNNLAIFFEDGSIGNNEKEGCYAMNYVVISNSMVREQTSDMTSAIIIDTDSPKAGPNVSGSGWAHSVTTNKASGFEGIIISANYGAFNRETKNNRRYFDLRPSAANSSSTITITAPEGYVIKSYSIKGISNNAVSYTVTAADGTNQATLDGSEGLTVDNIYSPTTTFTLTRDGDYADNKYANITDFTITLARAEFGVTLHRVNEGIKGKSYATLYYSQDLQQTDETTKAYYITSVDENGMVVLTETNNEGRDIPKETAVVLINSEGNTYTEFTIVSRLDPVVSTSANWLKGTLVRKTIDLTASSNLYSLGRRRKKPKNGEEDTWSEWVAGFYKNGQSTFDLSANRAHLDTSTPSASLQGTRGFDLPWDDLDETQTLIDDCKDDTPNRDTETPWYTLDGRKVGDKQPAAKGIYIKNGRKMVIK